MHTYKVTFRRLVDGVWGKPETIHVQAASLLAARAMVLTKDIQIERTVRT